MTTLSNMDFATEVKTDRLKTLYRFTFIVSAFFLLLVLTFGATRALSSPGAIGVALATVILLLGCVVTDLTLRRNWFNVAAWTYALSAVLGVGVMLYNGDDLMRQMVPFIAPIIVFVIGMLISPASTFVMGAVASAVILVAPWLKDGMFTLTPFQAFAIVLMFVSALLAVQVTGELYQVTQWALQNYQKERKTNDELFEKRRELQLSLKRSEVLSDSLREINKELEVAKVSAEDAKNFRGQFLANMSHELRTPLNAIIGFSETMLQFPIMYDNESLPQPYERDLSQIYSSGRQLLLVINDILDLAKVDAGKLEIHMMAVDIVPLINAAMSTTKGLIGSKSILLDKDIPETVPKVWADETRLRQVLLNIYSNAAKYTDTGSIKVTLRVTNDEVHVAIKDTGIGIAKEFHNKLFQEFQQAGTAGRDPRSGTGLGLAISKQLLTLMGGRIWFESELGVGSTFFIAVQVYHDQDKVAMPEKASAEG